MIYWLTSFNPYLGFNFGFTEGWSDGGGDRSKKSIVLRRSKGQCGTDPDRKVQIQDEIIIARSVHDVYSSVMRGKKQNNKTKSNLRMGVCDIFEAHNGENHWYGRSFWKQFKATVVLVDNNPELMHPHGSSTSWGQEFHKGVSCVQNLGITV